MKTFKLGERPIGTAHPPYVIAEIGSNHNGDMDLCRRLIDAAAEAGADAVKFQSWSEQSLASETQFAQNTSYADRKKHFGTLREMIRAYQFTEEQHRIAKAHCDACRITFASTPFSPSEADLLESLEVPFFKIASMDINYLRLLRYVARKQKPMLVSTGMATLGEIERAVAVIREEGNEQVVLLHCISIYPPRHEDIHLRNLGTLRQAFGVPVGFSDHSFGATIPLAAIALGACVIEKHFTIDKDLPGWDHAISADAAELRTIVDQGHAVFAALGSPVRTVSEAELEKRAYFRRSLIARRELKKGDVLSEEDLDFKRPGTGIPPDQVDDVLGRRLAVDKPADHMLEWSDLV